MTRKKVTIYTDGACSGNPGPGGWAAILIYGDKRKELSAGYRKTTNNRMELLGVIEGLRALKEPCDVTIYSDSKYVIEAFNKNWIINWQKYGWKNASKQPVKNRDLWEQLLEVKNGHKVTFGHVKGHANSPENNRCDELAVMAREERSLREDVGFGA